MFPFEPPYFEAHGLPATFIGHPIVDRPRPDSAKDPNALLLLPGSRMNEVRGMVPLFREAVENAGRESAGAALLGADRSDDAGVCDRTHGRLAHADRVLFREEDRTGAFRQAGTALAASGTVALELAQADVAGVITYRLSHSTYRQFMRQTSLKHLSLINILAGEEIMPERMQDAAQPDQLARDVQRLLQDESARERAGCRAACDAGQADLVRRSKHRQVSG